MSEDTNSDAFISSGELGEKLRAFRLQSGLRAEEVAAQLGISRASLYRYEKGTLCKLSTVRRMADLLRASSEASFRAEEEYYNDPLSYFGRLHELEQDIVQILQVHGPFCYLTTSDAYDRALAEIVNAASPEYDAAAVAIGHEVLSVLAKRKHQYQARRPNIIAVIPAASITRLLTHGLLDAAANAKLHRQSEEAIRAELANLAQLIEAEPMGLQVGVLPKVELTSRFEILRSPVRATLVLNPFRDEGRHDLQAGTATVTERSEVLRVYQETAETLWRDAIKGPAAAAYIRQLLAATPRIASAPPPG